MMSLAILAIATVTNNISGFSLSEEMDYSMSFDFGSYSDLPVNHSSLNEVTNTAKVLNDLDFSPEERTDITTEIRSDDIQKNDNSDQKINTKSEIEELSIYPRTNDEKIAILTFDDNWKSQYQYAKPILDKFQFKGTFYVVCDYIDKKNRISWNELQNLYTEGHEIGSHSMSHANLDDILTDVAHNEIVQSKKCIEDRGIKVSSFSYPFNSGDDDSEILDLVSNNYEFARTAGGDPGNKISSEFDDSLEQYGIIGWSHDAERKEHFYSDSEMLQKFKEYVDKYSNSDGKINHIPIIIYHKIEDSGDAYSTSVDLFESEMSYLYENGFKVITMDQVFGKN